MLGVEPSHLVFGTDAEARYRASGELVKKEMYEAAARQVADDQVRIAELERRLESLPATVEELGRTHHDLDCARRDLADLKAANKELRADVHRYQNGLAQAVAEYAALQSQLATLASELSSTSKASRASAILAAVGAVTGVVTVAHFLSKDEPPTESKSPPKKHRRKARNDD
jgi:chromosome segregation ATPase